MKLWWIAWYTWCFGRRFLSVEKHAMFFKFIFDSGVAGVSFWDRYLISQKLAADWLRSEVGKPAAIAEHDREEFARVPVAGDVTPGFCEGAKEPAKIELVGPDGDVNLVA